VATGQPYVAILSFLVVHVTETCGRFCRILCRCVFTCCLS